MRSFYFMLTILTIVVCSSAICTCPTNIEKLVKLQKRVVWIIDGQSRYAHTAPIFKKFKILRLTDVGKQQMMLLMRRKINKNLPDLVDELFTVFEAQLYISMKCLLKRCTVLIRFDGLHQGFGIALWVVSSQSLTQSQPLRLRLQDW